jgi:hypothetical protein
MIIATTGTTQISVADVYSRWKDWVISGNAHFLEAFSPVGGESIDVSQGTSIPLYAFLVNGWRLRPQEASHTLNVVGGVILVSGGGDPFASTLGNWLIKINYQQPVQAIGVSGSSSGGLTTAQDQRLERIEKFLRNKTITDPSTGMQTIYEDDGSTVFAEADLFEDASGNQRYRGQGAERREKLQ